ncbi:MAG: hypothetical protein WD770_11110 [Actinomycetota bacterium]
MSFDTENTVLEANEDDGQASVVVCLAGNSIRVVPARAACHG